MVRKRRANFAPDLDDVAAPPSNLLNLAALWSSAATGGGGGAGGAAPTLEEEMRTNAAVVWVRGPAAPELTDTCLCIACRVAGSSSSGLLWGGGTDDSVRESVERSEKAWVWQNGEFITIYI